MKILIVDDNQAVLDSLCTMFIKHGYSVDAACNGLAASERLHQETYDLLIIDHLMPIMNGIQLVKKLRQIDKYLVTPIIFMTTQGQNSLQAEYQSGLFNNLIDKPIDEESLLGLVGSYQKSNSHSLSL